MVLLGACHWAFAKINPSRPPIMNIDVNLRGRFTPNSNTYEKVGLLIGMCSVAETVSQFDFKTGNVSFWEFCRAIKKSALTSLGKGSRILSCRNLVFINCLTQNILRVVFYCSGINLLDSGAFDGSVAFAPKN